MRRLRALAFVVTAALAPAAAAQSSAAFRLTAALQNGAGSSSSPGLRVVACLGATPAGPAASSGYRVESGCAWAAGIYAGLPHANAVSGGGTQTTPVNQAFAQPLEVTVIDPFGDPVAGATVTFTPPASGASCALTGATAITDASGVARVTATANGTTGSYQVAASVPGLPAVSFSLTNAVVPVELQRFTAE